MKIHPGKAAAFTLIELLVVIAILAILFTLAVPSVDVGLVRGKMTGTLSNARQLHLATQTMTLETFNAGGAGLEWTSQVFADGEKSIPVSVQDYFGALVKNGYLTENDLKKLIAAPGKGPGSSAPTAANSCFKFFAVDERSPSDQPLLITANWDQRKLTADAPYGVKGFVVFTKGGSGGVYSRPSDAASPTIFPTSSTDPQANYRYVMLK